jgi:protein-tyrosine phosphatase
MVLLILCLMVAVAAVFGVAKLVDANHVGSGEPIEDIKVTDSALRIEYTIFSEEQQLILEPAKVYIEQNGATDLQTIKNNYRYNVDRLDTGLSVRIAYEVKGMPLGAEVASAKLEVSENALFTAPRKFTMSGIECYADVYLLKTNTKYYFRITLELSDGTTTGVHGTFTTANTPRILSIDGVPNVRDIGGWTTNDGSTVRQGLLYRGGELDGAVKTEYRITQTGIDHMLRVLKVRTQMDLRNSSSSAAVTNPLGESVTHNTYGAPQYADAFKSANAQTMRRIFSDLADEDNYPIYIHDTYGMDQVGTVCYILEAALGMTDEDLNREYRMSILCYNSLHGDEMNAFLEAFGKLDGVSRQEKAENYLLSIGVTAGEIEAIRDILLEPAPKTE